ncbi:DUF4236 domain-containing protein [Streptomyces sp. ISL-22]|uniref:DUF4236 domain-containing protein n=1 Tax=unclassified Streptomyces TaxID=2593676 RepID=UPI001BEB3912|nr:MULTISPECIES: DUF4236 domain-containing protein [unclassified Streptomyces]MBT2420327.1 DUF4236 domain-containing protein [Streptomyces sp. ISL-24]MBT2433059.1 DUF4236 domain-containing protein [Streptomyces sp. ISL-22]
MSLSIKIAPGLRVSASSRGIRTSIGPRAARLHVGAGRAGFSTSAGPLTYGTGLGGRSRSRAPRTSLTALERQARAAEKAAEYEAVGRVERALLSAHLEEFTPAAAPVLPAPTPVDPKALRDLLRRQAGEHIPRWKIRHRSTARRQADDRFPAALQEETTHRADEHASAQAAAEAEWARLTSGDPATVIAALEAAFEDNISPAAPIDSTGTAATVVVSFPPPTVVPERKQAITPSGRPTLHKRTKAERNSFYVRALASTVLATVKETLAAAPSVKEVTILVVRQDPDTHRPEDYLAAIYAGRFPRERLATLDWNQVDPVAELLLAPGAMLHRRGQAGDVLPLDLAAEPELAAVVAQLRADL